MALSFLFRFRDFIAPTIDEHKAIIRDHTSCWWGWWKRPSEDDRRDVWDALNELARLESPVEIGLFDSGHGRVYPARVTQVIPPRRDDHGTSIVPPLPPGDEVLVPTYYRTSPFSRAWMRLSHIDEPIRFFGEYSFERLPTLPYYAPATLSRFEGKVIVADAELRGMDTTIWQIRPSRADDRHETIIPSVPGVASPISNAPILTKSSRILHVTDPHFAVGAHREQHGWRLESEPNDGRRTLAEAIQQAVPPPIGLILVTGDLTFIGLPAEFTEARISLLKLLGIYDLDAGSLIVIPGNHDIKWTQEDAYDESARVTIAPAAAKENYRRFYRDLFFHDPNEDLSMGRRFVTPSGLVLEICAVNSSSLETGRHFLAGMGRVQEHAFVAVANALGWAAQPGLSLRLLALHHHLMLTEDLEPEASYYKGFGIAIDAPRILRLAATHGVQLALHGHKHRAFIGRSSIYELPEYAQPQYERGVISIVGGGSAGSTDVPHDSNYLNVIETESAGLTLKILRAQNRGAFQPMQAWKAGLELDGTLKRLVLADWRRLAEAQ